MCSGHGKTLLHLYSGVLAKFITQMLDGKAPTIFGDGKQSRFTYVDNVVEANLACKAEGSDRASIQCGHRTADGFVPDLPDS